jgi:hypothetical protein
MDYREEVDCGESDENEYLLSLGGQGFSLFFCCLVTRETCPSMMLRQVISLSSFLNLLNLLNECRDYLKDVSNNPKVSNLKDFESLQRYLEQSKGVAK